jgi:hypothetical protein
VLSSLQWTCVKVRCGLCRKPLSDCLPHLPLSAALLLHGRAVQAEALPVIAYMSICCIHNQTYKKNYDGKLSLRTTSPSSLRLFIVQLGAEIGCSVHLMCNMMNEDGHRHTTLQLSLPP